jgi:hypothetical protein
MKPISDLNIESELSYAYLHAVASSIGVNCRMGNRHEDNNGIDAVLTSWGPFPGTYIQELDLKVQLKATKATPKEADGFYSYFFSGVERYNELTETRYPTKRILVVLFLPDSPSEWLNVSQEELILKKSAYWVSLSGKDKSINKSGETVYLPKTQLLTPESLSDIFNRISKAKNIQEFEL